MAPLHGPALGRAQLLRVLALPNDSSETAIRSASGRLAGWLEQRRAALGPEAVAESAALARELDDLVRSTAWWTEGGTKPAATPAPFAWGRTALGLAFLAGLTSLAVLVLWTAGFRLTRLEGRPEPVRYATKALVFLDGDLGEASFRVLDADRAQVFDARPATGARVELEPGRYVLEVRREDCPEPWSLSVFLEPDSVQRYAPEICAGEGRLVVRSNTEKDRLRIDEQDVGHTGDRAHRLSVGEHAVRVDKAGYRPFEGRVRIVPDEVVELQAELTPLGEGGAPAGRPMPVTKVAPNLPPMAAAAQPFSKDELRGALAAPAIESPKLEPADLGLPKRGDFLAREGLPEMPDGGSTAWHDRVAGELRGRFDRDGSGEIDTLAESEAISCPVWREIERDFDRGGLGLSMAHYFGFDGSEWHPGALAVARAHRSAVYAKMQECGLDP
jgi:hypothetical protein